MHISCFKHIRLILTEKTISYLAHSKEEDEKFASEMRKLFDLITYVSSGGFFTIQ